MKRCVLSSSFWAEYDMHSLLAAYFVSACHPYRTLSGRYTECEIEHANGISGINVRWKKGYM